VNWSTGVIQPHSDGKLLLNGSVHYDNGLLLMHVMW